MESSDMLNSPPKSICHHKQLILNELNDNSRQSSNEKVSQYEISKHHISSSLSTIKVSKPLEPTLREIAKMKVDTELEKLRTESRSKSKSKSQSPITEKKHSDIAHETVDSPLRPRLRISM